MKIPMLLAAATGAVLLAGCAHDGRGYRDRTIVYGERHDHRDGRWDRHDRRDRYDRHDDRRSRHDDRRDSHDGYDRGGYRR